MKHIFISVLFFFVFVSGTVCAQTEPGFDCNTAESQVELMICADNALAKADAEMSKLFFDDLENLDDFQKDKHLNQLDKWIELLNRLPEQGFVKPEQGGVKRDKKKADNDELKKIVQTLYRDKIAAMKRRWNGESEEKEELEKIMSEPDNNTKMLGLKGLGTHYLPAVMQNMVLTGIQNPAAVKTQEFKENAIRVHLGHVLERLDSPQACGDMSFPYNMETTDYLSCYQNQECLLNVAMCAFTDTVRIPCDAAVSNRTVFIMQSVDGREVHTTNVSTCRREDFAFPQGVDEYIGSLEHRWRYINPDKAAGNSQAAAEYAKAEESYFLPAFKEDRGYTGNYPLERWSLYSYPNRMEYEHVMKQGIGFEKALDMLAYHYVEKFGAYADEAHRYAVYVMTPLGTESGKADKESLRYLILSGADKNKIRERLESGMPQNDMYSAESEGESDVDPILSVAFFRPDVMNMILELCPPGSTKESCQGLNTDVNAENDFGKTPLMYAAQYGILESAEILVNAGADINARTAPGSDRKCYESCMRNGGRTALMYAAQEGREDIIRYLVDKGADITLTDTQGMTAYDYLTGRAPEGDPTAPLNVTGTDLYPRRRDEDAGRNYFLTEEQIRNLAPLLKPAS